MVVNCYSGSPEDRAREEGAKGAASESEGSEMDIEFPVLSSESTDWLG